MKNTLTHIVNYEKRIFDKKIIWKYDMASFKLGKTLEYRKIQESLQSENLTEDYLRNGIFLYVFPTLKNIIQAQSKTNHWIS